MMRIVLACCIALLLWSPDVQALDQEKLDQLTQVMNIGCSLGESYRFKVGGDGKILLFKSGLKGEFEASRDKTNSIINFIASDGGKRDVAEDTRQCMKPYMDRIFDAILGPKPESPISKTQCTPGSTPATACDLGILNGQIGEITGMLTKSGGDQYYQFEVTAYVRVCLTLTDNQNYVRVVFMSKHNEKIQSKWSSNPRKPLKMDVPLAAGTYYLALLVSNQTATPYRFVLFQC